MLEFLSTILTVLFGLFEVIGPIFILIFGTFGILMSGEDNKK